MFLGEGAYQLRINQGCSGCIPVTNRNQTRRIPVIRVFPVTDPGNSSALLVINGGLTGIYNFLREGLL